MRPMVRIKLLKKVNIQNYSSNRKFLIIQIFTSMVKFLPKYFAIFDAVENWIVFYFKCFIVSGQEHDLFVDFIFHTLLNLLIYFSKLFMYSLGFSTDKVISSVKTIMKRSEVAQSCPTLCDPLDCSLQAPPSVGFSRQEYWNGLPFLSPEDLPYPRMEPVSPAVQADALPSEPCFISFPCFITVAKTSSTVLIRCNKSRQTFHIPDLKGAFLS